MFTKVPVREISHWKTEVSSSLVTPLYSDSYAAKPKLFGVEPSGRYQLLSSLEGHRTLAVIEEPFSSKTVTDHIVEMTEHDISHFTGYALSEIDEVEYVLTKATREFLRVWTVIDKLDRGVRDGIYDIELAIMDKFPEMEFDFHVICRQGKDAKALLPSEARLVFSKDANR